MGDHRLDYLEGIFFTEKYEKEKEELAKISKEIEERIVKKIDCFKNKGLPKASLYNEFELPVDIETLINTPKAILFFYRGNWCPYSSLNVKYLMKNKDALLKKGYKVVAISNYQPSSNLSLRDRANLSISILSDSGNILSEELGITYVFTPKLKEIYKKSDIAPEYNTCNKLVFPTMFIVDNKLMVEDIIIREDEIYIEDIEELMK